MTCRINTLAGGQISAAQATRCWYQLRHSTLWCNER